MHCTSSQREINIHLPRAHHVAKATKKSPRPRQRRAPPQWSSSKCSWLHLFASYLKQALGAVSSQTLENHPAGYASKPEHPQNVWEFESSRLFLGFAEDRTFFHRKHLPTFCLFLLFFAFAFMYQKIKSGLGI